MAIAVAPAAQKTTLATFLAALDPLLPPVGELDATQLIDELTALQELASYLLARQAHVVREHAKMTADESAARHETPRQTTLRQTAMYSQIALAKKCTPTHGQRFVAFATLLVDELPHTLDALTTGTITEWAATLVVSEISHLPVEDRWLLDHRLAGQFHGKSPAHLTAIAHQIACELNQEAIVERNEKAVAQRRVSVRPAADGMSILTAILPMSQGVAVWAALRQTAVSAKAGGDSRSQGQLMADSLCTTITSVLGVPCAIGAGTTTMDVTGTAAADSRFSTTSLRTTTIGAPAAVPEYTALPAGTGVMINLVMTDTALLGDCDTPATITASGMVPAAIPAATARDLIGNAPPDIKVWLRRLFTRPGEQQLAAMDSRQRLFPAALREYLTVRDQRCRTPWCGAPITEIDHINPHSNGGATSASNGQGYCRRCNTVKEAGRHHTRSADGTITVRTATGHTYSSPEPVLISELFSRPASVAPQLRCES